MPTSFGSYDTNQDGTISQAEWDAFYPSGGGPASGGEGGLDIQQLLDFFGQLTSAFGDSGFEFTPEMLESFGVIMPALGIYSEFSKAEYQQDALDFMREELGVKGMELDLAREQLEFESGPAWEWYKNEFFPATQEMKRLELETQQYLMGGQQRLSDQEVLQAIERTNQALEGTNQAREGTRQAQIASEIARYNALSQIGLGQTTRTADGRSVRGSGFTYGYV